MMASFGSKRGGVQRDWLEFSELAARCSVSATLES
jgi:hypothetical protein